MWNVMGNTNKNSSLLWKLTFFAGIFGGVGGVLVDFDHILNAATGIVEWAEFHTLAVFLFLLGMFVASIGGLFLSLVLRK